MSRPTDTERGARMALAICDQQLQPQLFPRELDQSWWLDIHHLAVAELVDAEYLRRAVLA